MYEYKEVTHKTNFKKVFSKKKHYVNTFSQLNKKSHQQMREVVKKLKQFQIRKGSFTHSIMNLIRLWFVSLKVVYKK